jgi:hypothetical protein
MNLFGKPKLIESLNGEVNLDDLKEFFDFFLSTDSKQREAVLGRIANFRGLLRIDQEYSFIKITDLIQLYISLFYSKDIVAVILDPQLAMEYVPKIKMLKRDNLDAYLKAKQCNLIIVDFETVLSAEDWVFSFPTNEIKYEIYNQAKLVRTEKGKI